MSGTAPTGNLEQALGRMRMLLGRDPVLAAEQAQEILKAVPEHGETLLLLGRALGAQGQTREAIAVLRRAAARMPQSPDAWRVLGDHLVLAGDGRGADAAYARQIRASVNDPQLRAAATALCDNNIPVAERLLRQHLKAKPTDVAAIRMLAEVAGRIGRNADARTLLERAIELAPGFAPARFNLATVLYRQARFVEALEELETLLKEEPDNPAYQNLKGAALARFGEFDGAIAQFEQVLAIRPSQPKIWLSYGHTLKTVGRQEESIGAYRKAIALDPAFGEAWWSLANLKTVRFGEADIAAMEAALASPQTPEHERVHFHFALGKALEDAERWDNAFAHYVEANRLRRQALPYDAEETHRKAMRSAALITREFVEARRGQGCTDGDPIFILGMPRAGSTLLEQILASHPLVEGTQELPDIQLMARRLGSGGAYPECLAGLAPSELEALGREYLERTRAQRKTGRPFFIDKMPNNWPHAGFIHLILPNARIVDARRHPLACCVSNFRQHFAVGQAFSYDLADLGRYYADYAALMAHFDAAMPGKIVRVLYEDVVADAEGEIRRLLDALGLPFDAACLRYYETERSVRTASSEQVRRPIYREGLEAWRRYAPYLGALEAALGFLPECYGSVSRD